MPDYNIFSCEDLSNTNTIAAKQGKASSTEPTKIVFVPENRACPGSLDNARLIKDLNALVISSDLQEFTTIKTYVETFADFKLNVELAATPQSAQKLIERGKVDLFIIDYCFENASALELIRKINQNADPHPIIFISQDENYSLDEAAIKAGALEYVVKGCYRARQLERCIINAIQRNNKKTDQARHSRFSRTLIRISTEFINLLPHEIDSGITTSISDICNVAELDIGFIVQHIKGDKLFNITHLAGRSAFNMQFTGTPFKSGILDSIYQQASNINNKTYIDPELLKGELDFISHIPILKNVRSLFCIPLISQQKPFGIIVFASLNEFGRLLLNEKEEIESVAHIFINALQRKQEFTARVRAEQALRTVVEGTASTTADDFFRSLTKHLAGILNTRYAFVGKINDTACTKVQTLAVWKDNDYIPNEEYSLPGTPSEKIIGNTFLKFRSNVRSVFPDDRYLEAEQIESYMGAPLFDSNGRAIGILAVMDSKVMEDWAPGRWILRIFAARAGAELERILVEEERSNLQLKLLQSQKMEAIGQLAAGIAHDLNNALFAVAGHLQLIKMGAVEGPNLSISVNSALTGCERASSLIGQLLCFSRQGKYNLETNCLQSMVNETLDFLSKVIEKDIIIEQGQCQGNYSVLADQAQIQQALTNLIINAKQAMPAGGTIKFTYSRRYIANPVKYNLKALAGDYLCLSISDNGLGISEENQERIFEPFFTTKEVGKGSGLGLSMVYGIMQNHGGWVEVNSIENAGSTFSLYFPCLNEKHSHQLPLRPDNKPTLQGTILVIDDEPELVELMKKFLQHIGLSVFGFSSPLGGLKWYKEHAKTVDMIIIDMKMPKMGGVELFRELKKVNQHARIVMLSGYVQDDAVQNLLEDGALRFFQKPVKYEEFINWICLNFECKETSMKV